jgi:clan AA aspartic protease (TIGR02281 family)
MVRVMFKAALARAKDAGRLVTRSGRSTAIIFSFVASSSPAFAFDCAGVSLPSSVVICSDPELMDLADQRQVAINEARGRIGETAWPVLWEDQKAWVKSYATSCGVPPEQSPPDPMPQSVRACFKRAALSRIAYLRAYGGAARSNADAKEPSAVGNRRTKIIPLEQSNGVYTLPVRINDAISIPFVLDSGAAEVAIPADVFSTLRRAGLVTDNDFRGSGTYVLADGSQQTSQRFLLHKLSVGDSVVEDVIANVVSIRGDALLGQSFLSKLSGWSIDNNQHALVLYDEAGRLQQPDNELTQRCASSFSAKNYTEAMQSCIAAANKGDPIAMSYIGWLYNFGLGVPQDYAEAMRWYRLAAAKGEAAAMNSIASFYEQGLVVTQNNAEAARWYRLAADKGLPEAMTNIGGYLAWGKGTNKDCSAARLWLGRAATVRIERADNWLRNGVDGQCRW